MGLSKWAEEVGVYLVVMYLKKWAEERLDVGREWTGP